MVPAIIEKMPSREKSEIFNSIPSMYKKYFGEVAKFHLQYYPDIFMVTLL